MGTQGIVRVFDGDREILCLSAQSDGYPEGFGREVADFCAGKRIVNGIGSNARLSAIANGAGCLAAQLVAHFKDGPGGFYILAPGAGAPSYEYHVKCPDFRMVDAARDAAAKAAGRFGTFDGLPIVVEAFECEDGWGGRPIKRTPVKIPDGTVSEEDSDEDDATPTGSDAEGGKR